ncbi:hypothetical protein J3R30DRAFT_3656103 [Lentinula aciculospora]|uniref:Uncharacterized protein n=1 Tax=Lentinula aciculospora TaxID=153920 RepID=A0A9W9DRA7_9AGAR|nr:hypothetical protein J3R30DRAFT_3656103 [Lentinula aciculospora]
MLLAYGYLLIGTHLSSLFPQSRALSIYVQTQRVNTPLSSIERESDPAEHALYSSVLQTPSTGTILLRVLHGGLIVEFVSLSTQNQPLRFVFPSAVLLSPGIFLWENDEIHFIAVTITGSIYRAVIPTGGGLELWHNRTQKIWISEYLIKNFSGTMKGLVHIHSTHCVFIGLPNGSLMRLETEYAGSERLDGEWTESIFQAGSFLSSFKSFLPSLSSANSDAGDIISLATHPWPTDVGYVWTLSRDRVLRFWKPKIGCVYTSTSITRKPHVLLDAARQILLRVFSFAEDYDHFYVLAFLPAIPSSTFGGSFQLLDTLSDQVTEVGTIQCSRHTAHCHLQDFMVIGNVLYALWGRQGQAMVEKTMLDLDSIRNDGFSVWETALCATEAELTPAHLEEILMGKDCYTDACLSLPGSPPHPLTVTYASLEENIAAVVGYPSNGALQYDKYWNALKRDWEGFIARCREIERSQGEIIVVELAQDLPIHLHQVLSHDLRIADSQYDLFGILWTLLQKVGRQTMLSLENCLVDLMHQEIAFSFTDILKDQASQFHFKDNLDEGANIWLFGRLASVDNLDDAVRTSLDVIGGLDMGVKREEEVELLLPPPVSDWFRGLTASYNVTTTNARYDLCLCLMALLFFLVDDLSDWDPSLLAEVFAVFRGTATLPYIVRQPSSATTQTPLDDVSSADDVVSLLQNMQVSRNRNHSTSTYSLVHRLLIQTGDLSHEFPGAAHRFLDSTALLQSITPAVASKAEVSFCEKLRVLGYMHVSRELLSWLPRAPSVSYVLSRIWLNAGRVDDAACILEKLAGCLGPDNALSQEDRDTLQDVLPSSHLFDSLYPFYLYIATLFKSNSLQYHEVHFTKLALSVAPPMLDTSSLWHTVVRGYIDLGLFDEAYAAWISTPSDTQKREHISYNQVDKLLSHNFAGFANEVEDALSFNPRNEDPSMLPRYTRILYSWFLSRGDYRNAALTMYQKARKLRGLMTRDPSLVTRLAGEQLEAYLISMNYCSGYSHGKYENEIVQLTDIQYEYTLLSAILSSSIFYRIEKLAQSNRFNTALATARRCHCVSQGDTSDWLLTDNALTWPGSPADKGWRYLGESIK